MNPNDFGIGFDFSDDFSLAWGSDSKSVTVTFNNVTKRGGGECNLYVTRLRDGGSNFIAAPIHHSFTVLSLIEPSAVTNKNRQADLDFAIESANGKGYTVYLSASGVEGPYRDIR